MRAAGLHAIHTLLTSEAVLIRSTTPSPSSSPASLALIARISSRIAGVIAASKYVLVGYNIRREMVKEATKITPGRRAATVSPLDDPEWVAVSSMVLKAEVADVMDRLTEIGTFFFFFPFQP
jgi:ATP phosphoribosyltransferase